MEDVLTEKRIRGFINQNGIFMKVTDISFDDLDVIEVTAESICFDIEKCLLSTAKIEEELKRLGIISENKIFSSFLIEHYGYLYVELSGKNGSIDIINMIHPKDIKRITEHQKNRLKKLCHTSTDMIESNPKLLFLK